MLSIEDVQTIIDEVEYLDWNFVIGGTPNHWYLQLRFGDLDDVQLGRKWKLSPHMTKSEVVQTAFLAVKTAVEHELRESFRYSGRAIFNPHFDVDKLAELAKHSHNLDLRTGAWVAEA